jgi:hypothetical protein
MSEDTGLTLVFPITPGEQDRNFGANWEDAGVANASIQFSEHREGRAEKRIVKATFDAYSQGGLERDIENFYDILKKFSENVPRKPRAHRLLLIIGNIYYRCLLEDVGFAVHRTSLSGGAMQAIDIPITLKQRPAPR